MEKIGIQFTDLSFRIIEYQSGFYIEYTRTLKPDLGRLYHRYVEESFRSTVSALALLEHCKKQQALQDKYPIIHWTSEGINNVYKENTNKNA